MLLRHVTAVIAALYLTLGSARASSIGVFFDADATDCDAQIPANASFQIYVIALLGGDAAAGGIIQAEYRLTGADPAWFTMVTPNPGANLVIGSPFVGANIAWPTCQTPATGMLLLHTIDVVSPALTAPRVLRVEVRGPPTDPELCATPQVTLCDVTFTLLCVRGGQAFINRDVSCTVAVTPATWTQVKELYTN